MAVSALARLAAEDFVTAEMIAKSALRADPRQVDALNVLAIAACRRRDYPQALEMARRALAREPRSAQLHMNHGNILRESGDAGASIAAFDRAIELDGDLEAALFNLGLAHVDAGNDSAAADAFERYLGPGSNTEQLMDLAQRLHRLNRFDAMVVVLRRASSRSSNDHRLLSDLSMALLELGRPDLAEAPIRRAVELAPEVALLHRNLGTVLLEQGRFEEALASGHRSLELDPSRHESRCLLGVVQAALRCPELANAEFTRARQSAPDDPLTALRHGMALLAVGDFAKGLPLLEHRLDDARILPWDRLEGIPRWRGEDLSNRSILVLAEQGHGDALQFVRYVPMLRALGASVHVVCHPGLARLFQANFGAASVLRLGAPLPRSDFYCPMMSLPLAFGTALDSIPSTVPYLRADDGDARAWAARFDADPRPRVGFCWAGNPEYGTDRRRSISASFIEPLTAVAAVHFVSLQKTPDGMEAAHPKPGFALTDWTSELRDFADTAALIRSLDLVISVDTAVVHLAGAIGKQVWLLNRFDTDWRWGWTGDRSPWYPTMRVFRQATPGAWSGVIQAVAQALEEGITRCEGS